MASTFYIIRKNYAKYMKQYEYNHDKVTAQLKIDFENTTTDNWDYCSKMPLEWWKKNYKPNKW